MMTSLGAKNRLTNMRASNSSTFGPSPAQIIFIGVAFLLVAVVSQWVFYGY
jgi:hypothetical protein